MYGPFPASFGFELPLCVIRLQFYKWTMVVNDERKQERRRRSMHHSITGSYVKPYTQQVPRLRAILTKPSQSQDSNPACPDIIPFRNRLPRHQCSAFVCSINFLALVKNERPMAWKEALLRAASHSAHVNHFNVTESFLQREKYGCWLQMEAEHYRYPRSKKARGNCVQRYLKRTHPLS